MQPVLLCAYEVDAEPIFDTLDPSHRTRRAVTDVELRCPDWEQKMLDGGIPASHALAERLVADGYVGMRVRSFAPGAGPDDLNLVFWRWGDRLPSRIELIDDDHRLTPASRPPPEASGNLPPETDR